MRLALASLCLAILVYSVTAKEVTEEGNCRCVKGKCIQGVGYGHEVAESLELAKCKCVLTLLYPIQGRCVHLVEADEGRTKKKEGKKGKEKKQKICTIDACNPGCDICARDFSEQVEEDEERKYKTCSVYDCKPDCD